MQIAYLEGLLSSVAKEFLNHVADAFGNGLSIKHVDFDAAFMEVRRKVDKEALQSKKPQGMRSFAETKKGQAVEKNKEEKGITTAPAKKKGKSGGGAGSDEDDDEEGDDEDAQDKAAEARSKSAGKAKNGTAKDKKKEE